MDEDLCRKRLSPGFLFLNKMSIKKRKLFLPLVMVLMLTYMVSTRSQCDESSARPPFVDGWHANTSKNSSNYVSESLKPFILPREFCQRKALLLVIVFVRIDNIDGRAAIRETWAQYHEDVVFYFLIGQDRNSNPELQLQAEEESARYNDIIQENFIDTYTNLTLKSVNMLKLFHLHCSGYKFLMKIDDDVFLNLPNVLEMLRDLEPATDVLIGRQVDAPKPNRHSDTKWYMPYELYSQDAYPPYLCGPTYLMSADVAEKLYVCTLETPMIHIEDAYITGICAQKMHVLPQNNSRFTCLRLDTKYICPNRHLFTLHYHTPREIRESFNILKEGRCWTPGGVMEWLYSLFY